MLGNLFGEGVIWIMLVDGDVVVGFDVMLIFSYEVLYDYVLDDVDVVK